MFPNNATIGCAAKPNFTDEQMSLPALHGQCHMLLFLRNGGYC